jgi:bifunctional ADP-heptose synthase (sugar kinase/adenylyltransferase)
MIMSHLADPGDDSDYDEFVAEKHLTGNAGDAYNLGYEHGREDGRLVGLAEARALARLLVDGVSAEEAVARMEGDERDAAESERRAAEAAMEDDSEQS